MTAILREVPNVLTFIDRCFHSNIRALSVCPSFIQATALAYILCPENTTRRQAQFMISVALKSLLFSQHRSRIYDSRPLSELVLVNIVSPFCMTIK